VSSLVSTEDEAKHGQMRKGVAIAFALPSVLEMEEKIQGITLLLIDIIQKRTEVDIARQLLWYSLDTASLISFSEDIGFLRSDSDVGGTAKCIRGKLHNCINSNKAFTPSDIRQTGLITGAGGVLSHGLNDSFTAIQ
jgi:hypothetical protein